MISKRKELKFQGHIIDSYMLQGGHGRKWATELMVGMPDLILTMPKWGIHLAEAKHRPDWTTHREYKNPMTPKQRDEAHKYTEGGGLVLGYVIIASTDAIGSLLCVYDPLKPTMTTSTFVPYVLSVKYDINTLLEAYHASRQP